MHPLALSTFCLATFPFKLSLAIFPAHLHWHFHDFPKTAALSAIVFDHSFAPAIAVCLDLQALLRVRRLAKESRLYDQHLKVEIAAEKKAREEEEARIEADASEIFMNRYPMLVWSRLVAGEYMGCLPEDVPSPRFWRGYARRLHDLWHQPGLADSLTGGVE